MRGYTTDRRQDGDRRFNPSSGRREKPIHVFDMVTDEEIEAAFDRAFPESVCA